MFRILAHYLTSRWPIFLIVWLGVFAALYIGQPPWERVVTQGEFSFLPAEAHSQRAQRLLKEAFPESDYGSSLLFMIERIDGPLRPEDLAVFGDHLLPLANAAASALEQADIQRLDQKMIMGAMTPDIPVAGRRLESSDGKAALGLVQLASPFLHEQTWWYINEVEKRLLELEESGILPAGLTVHIAGSAVLGRDITRYRTESAQWIQDWTVWLVVGLLLLVYRAPLIALIPLVTLAVAVQTARALLAFMAEAGWITLFDGIEVYLTVIAYGAGVDYSLFLISRYQEEMRRHESTGGALGIAVRRTGTAIAASACTEILGIFMLVFAAFGKLSQSGVAIAIALGVMLLASLTLTPAVLRVGGRWAFWPKPPRVRHGDSEADESSIRGLADRLWNAIGALITGHPKKVLAGVLIVLLPPAALGVWKFQKLSFGLVAELPKSSTTTQSIDALQQHFALGMVAPLTVLIENPDVNFNSAQAQGWLAEWNGTLAARKDELKLADIQDYSEPLGLGLEPPSVEISPLVTIAQDEFTSFQAAQHYIAQTGKHQDHVTRARLLMSIEPFSREAIRQLDQLERSLHAALPKPLRDGATLYLSGPTSSLRSMQVVALRDQKLLFPLVTVTVLVVLMVLLRKIYVPLFLAASVILTFLVTVGVTWGVFRLIVGAEFAGLDWTVPLLLFTLLMAVGADYNVLLVSRADEEVERRGLKDGLVTAVRSTGAVITGCGLVMSGTFATLLIGGRLTSMRQLGFALAFSILLDTFVIRAFLVPAYLMLRGQWRRRKRQDQEL